MARPIYLFLNPNAKMARHLQGSLSRLQSLLPAGSKVFRTSSIEELESVFTKDLTKSPNGNDPQCPALCFLGGDGSLSNGLTFALRQWGTPKHLPPVLAIRGGTINMVCNELEIKKGIENILILFQEEKWEPHVKIPLLKVELEGALPRYGFVFASGVGFHILKKYYRDGPPGAVTGFKVACKTFVKAMVSIRDQDESFRSRPLDLSFNQKVFHFSHVRSVVAGTLSKVSLGIRPYPFKAGSFSFGVSVNSMPLWKVVLLSPRLLFGVGDQILSEGGELLSSALGKELCFELDEGFVLDGDLHSVSSPRRIKISLGPEIQFFKK